MKQQRTVRMRALAPAACLCLAWSLGVTAQTGAVKVNTPPPRGAVEVNSPDPQVHQLRAYLPHDIRGVLRLRASGTDWMCEKTICNSRTTVKPIQACAELHNEMVSEALRSSGGHTLPKVDGSPRDDSAFQTANARVKFRAFLVDNAAVGASDLAWCNDPLTRPPGAVGKLAPPPPGFPRGAAGKLAPPPPGNVGTRKLAPHE